MSEQAHDERPSGWHQVSIGHLVMGLAFLGIVGVWALIETDTVTGDDIHWLFPIPWVLAGAVGLAATAITGPRRHAVRQTGWVGDRPAEAEHDLPKYPQPTGTEPTETPEDQS